MSEIARQRRPQVTLARMPGNRASITGPLAEVSLALDWLQRRGELLSASPPQPTGSGEFLVNCRLLPPVQRTPEPRRGLSRAAWAAIVAGLLVVLGLLGWLAYELLEVVVHNALAIIGGLLLLALLFGGVGRACVTHITIRHHH